MTALAAQSLAPAAEGSLLKQAGGALLIRVQGVSHAPPADRMEETVEQTGTPLTAAAGASYQSHMPPVKHAAERAADWTMDAGLSCAGLVPHERGCLALGHEATQPACVVQQDGSW